MEQIKGHHWLTVGCSAHNDSTSFSFLSISYQTGWTLIAAVWMDGKQVYRGSLIFCCMCHTCFSVKPQAAAVYFFILYQKDPMSPSLFPYAVWWIRLQMTINLPESLRWWIFLCILFWILFQATHFLYFFWVDRSDKLLSLDLDELVKPLHSYV